MTSIIVKKTGAADDDAARIEGMKLAGAEINDLVADGADYRDPCNSGRL
jgi:hypothetical protein